MGLLDIFSKGKRDDRSRAKNIERAVNKTAQSPDRFRALELLAEDGSDEALYGLLRRFGFTYHKSIEDEQEKDWAFEALCEKGAAALPAVRRCLLSADSISWPLRVLEKVASVPEQLAALQAVLERHEPGYERDPTTKTQALAFLGQLAHEGAAPLLAPYLKDMDEGVRFAAIEALLRHKAEAVAREPLIELFVSDEEESLRLRLRICEGFADLGWIVTEGASRTAFAAKLPDAYLIEKDGRVRRRSGAGGPGATK
jgi:hypothetical protein